MRPLQLPSQPAAASLDQPARLRRLRFWLRLLLAPPLAGAAVYLLFQVPLPLLEGWLPVRDCLAAPSAVAVAGKVLYDTLFYDRYQP